MPLTIIKQPDKITSDKITVIIPSAGIGRRMKYHGAKALLELPNHETIIERQLRIIREVLPLCEIIVVVGFQADKIISLVKSRYRTRFVYSPNYEITSVVHSISLGLFPCLSSRVLILYGDLVFNSDTLLKTVGKGNISNILTSDKGQILTSEVGVTTQNNLAEHFGFDISTKWAQCIFLVDNVLNTFKSLVHNLDNSKIFTYEILNQLLSHNHQLYATNLNDGQLVEVDNIKDIERITF